MPTPSIRIRRVLVPLLVMTLGSTPALVGCSGHEEDTTASDAAPTGTLLVADVQAAPRPTGPVASDISCINSGCHATFATAPSVHGVLRVGRGCMVCHEDDRGGHVFPVKRPGSAGCIFCHESIVGQRVHQHGATQVDCLECHDPHASAHGPLLRAASTSDLCRRCHALEHPEVPHSPYGQGECVACHTPHESDFAGLLRGGEGEEHCAMCHEETHDAIASASFVHAPAAADCRTCHGAHGSDHAHLLPDDVDQTCFSCHQDIEQLAADTAAPHGALMLNDQCANCHDAHASNQPSLLRSRQDELCLSCHDRTIEAFDGRTIPNMAASVRDRAFLHGPVEQGQCTACHTVHGGSHTRLLRQQFSAEFYTSFDLSSYALCFDCHEKELVTEERTTALTGFRNGSLNLHYLHVNREKKGRTCRACHELHGSDLPAHVAAEVPFDNSEWLMPIGFEQTDTGGSCSPGCHKPMGYDRIQPIPLPTLADPVGDEGGSP